MAKRKITPAEAAVIQDGLIELAEILEAIGIVEMSLSKAKQEVFWDTEGGGKVDPKMLEFFFDGIDRLYADALNPSSFH